MLHVRMLSGEAVTSILVEEMDDVEALKQRLTQLHGFPPRFRQRVLQRRDLGGRSEAGLPQDLGPHSAQVEELAAAATQGSVSEVGSGQKHTYPQHFSNASFLHVYTLSGLSSKPRVWFVGGRLEPLGPGKH